MVMLIRMLNTVNTADSYLFNLCTNMEQERQKQKQKIGKLDGRRKLIPVVKSTTMWNMSDAMACNIVAHLSVTKIVHQACICSQQ